MQEALLLWCTWPHRRADGDAPHKLALDVCLTRSTSHSDGHLTTGCAHRFAAKHSGGEGLDVVEQLLISEAHLPQPKYSVTIHKGLTGRQTEQLHCGAVSGPVSRDAEEWHEGSKQQEAATR